MISLIPSADIFNTVSECVNSDVKAYKHAHRDFNMDAEEAIEFITKDLKSLQNYVLYDVKDDKNNLVGMIGIESNINVHPFFIKPTYRKQILNSWKLMKAKLDKNFIMSAYKTNERGIKFYKRMNGVYIGSVKSYNQDLLIYKFENGSN
jgi:hypothetical protein